jgi:hypothetical protein
LGARERAGVNSYTEEIEFLGYAPFEYPDDPIEKLRYFKQVKGLSYKRLDEMMGRDPEQLSDWLSSRIKPCRKIVERIAKFLAENAE